MSTFADGEFWSKKSTIPSGIGGGDGFNAAFHDLAAFSLMENIGESGFSSTFKDFKLPKQGSLIFNNSGIKKRT